MTPLPPPATFAEGQRALFGWLMAASGVFCGFGFAGIILLLWLGGWSQASESQRIGAIAMMGAGFPLGMISVIIAMAVGGPVGRFKAGLTKDGANFEAGKSDAP
jgi:hypothetical protein